MTPPFKYDPKHYFEFRRDGTYSYVNAYETIDGLFKINSKEQTPYKWIWVSNENVEKTEIMDAALFKMLASGSNTYDRLWAYVPYSCTIQPVEPSLEYIFVHFYQGNELVMIKSFWGVINAR